MPDEDVAVNAHRRVGGRLIDSSVVHAGYTRVELLRRSSSGAISWQFRQPTLTLIWFRTGVREFRLDIDGRCFEETAAGVAGLCYFPAQVDIEGEFRVDALCDYTVVFVEPELVASHTVRLPDRPVLGISHGPLVRSLRDLSREALRADSVFGLYAEGWALQSLAHLARLGGGGHRHQGPTPGLPASSLRRVEDFVRAHLAERLTVDDLAAAAGFSRRHFLRAFKQSVGQTPLRYVQELRLDEARRQLAAGRRPVTDIAADCGFSHVQHFSTAFRRATGLTPSQFRGVS